jgi:hypothetical protein
MDECGILYGTFSKLQSLFIQLTLELFPDEVIFTRLCQPFPKQPVR